MTLQPTEPQQIVDNTWKLHKELLLELDESDDLDISQVRFLLKTLAQAGASLGDTEDRSLLLELIRYWSSFIDRKTGEFPVIQLQPFDISRKRIPSEALEDSITSPVELGNNPEEALPLNNHSQSSTILLSQPLVTPSERPQGFAFLPAIWNVPYPRNPFFTGRDFELEQIHSYLQAGQATAFIQPYALSGLGGIGKTQIAIEYAYRYHKDYEAVLWVRAESIETLSSSYATLAGLLNLPEQETQDQETIVQAIKIWLQTYYRWLLIFDNADDLNLLLPFLPLGINGHILLTTRASSMGRLATRLEVDPLYYDQGALFLLRRSGLLAPDLPLEQAIPQHLNWATILNDHLGGLPLALDQSGAYMEATGLSVHEYYYLYQQHRLSLLGERGSLVPDHPESVATTWSLSFQRVEEKNPAAADLLRFCAYLAPDAIPEEIIIQGATHLGPLLEPVVTDLFLFAQSIEALRSYSLVSRNPQTRMLSIHRLVQAVLQDSMPFDIAQQWKRRSVFAVNMACPNIQDSNQWEACERWLPHALTCAIWIDQEQIMELPAANLLSQAGLYLDIRARYGEAEPLLRRALEIREQELGNEHPETVVSLSNLAFLYLKQDRYSEAEPLYERALSSYERALAFCQQAGDKLGEADLLKAIGDAQLIRAEQEEALSIYRAALELFKQVGSKLGEANVRKEIGDVQQSRDEQEEALSNYETALALYQQMGDRLGEANCYLALGNMIFQQRQNEHALELYNQAYTLYQDIGDSYSQARLLYSRSYVHEAMNNLQLAIEDMQISLSIVQWLQLSSSEAYQQRLQKLQDQLP